MRMCMARASLLFTAIAAAVEYATSLTPSAAPSSSPTCLPTSFICQDGMLTSDRCWYECGGPFATNTSDPTSVAFSALLAKIGVPYPHFIYCMTAFPEYAGPSYHNSPMSAFTVCNTAVDLLTQRGVKGLSCNCTQCDCSCGPPPGSGVPCMCANPGKQGQAYGTCQACAESSSCVPSPNYGQSTKYGCNSANCLDVIQCNDETVSSLNEVMHTVMCGNAQSDTSTGSQKDTALSTLDKVLIAFASIIVVVLGVYGVHHLLSLNKHNKELVRSGSLREQLLHETRVDLEEATANNTRLRGAWQINANDVHLQERIAEGGYGVVYRGEYADLTVAVKVMKSPLSVELGLSSSEFAQECETLMSIKHANLLVFYGAGINAERKPFLVTEFMTMGSLQSVLANRAIELSWAVRHRIALQLAKAMKYLHERGFVHRDLKSDNCLLNNNLNAKVADFGTSKLLTKARLKLTDMNISGEMQSGVLAATMTGGVGTVLWMAPELFRAKASYDSAIDVYSYGVIMWELVTRRVPWDDILRETNYIEAYSLLCDAFENGNRPLITADELNQANQEFVTLLQQCWATEPTVRPSFSAVVRRLA